LVASAQRGQEIVGAGLAGGGPDSAEVVDRLHPAEPDVVAGGQQGGHHPGHPTAAPARPETP
jgi:hypothetical protein